MKKNGQKYSQEFKIAAVARVMQGERVTKVARDLDIGMDTIWRWRKTVEEKGEQYLRGSGRPVGVNKPGKGKTDRQERIAELEQLVGRQQMGIRFLDKALRRVEERRQEKNDDGGAASTK